MRDEGPIYLVYPCDTPGCRHGFVAQAKSLVLRPERLCPTCARVTMVDPARAKHLLFSHFQDKRRNGWMDQRRS
jgi:hypothetical protein